jgi:enediyne biosynthesis protein E4
VDFRCGDKGTDTTPPFYDTLVFQGGECVTKPMLLFRNTGTTLKNVSAESGPTFSQPLAARGMALRDFENNGSVDVLVTVNNGAPILLRNNAGTQNHWLGVRLIGKKSNPDAVGATITYQAGDLNAAVQKSQEAVIFPLTILAWYWD